MLRSKLLLAPQTREKDPGSCSAAWPSSIIQCYTLPVPFFNMTGGRQQLWHLQLWDFHTAHLNGPGNTNMATGNICEDDLCRSGTWFVMIVWWWFNDWWWDDDSMTNDDCSKFSNPSAKTKPLTWGDHRWPLESPDSHKGQYYHSLRLYKPKIWQ